MDLFKFRHSIEDLDFYKNLMAFVNQEYQSKVVFPAYDEIFKAFDLLKGIEVKVVILGQDPYHTRSFAHGLAFSVKDHITLPKSLVNIYKELQDDINVTRTTGDLTNWAKQGVFLLNTILTVEEGKPLSHQNKGWEILTKMVIEQLNADISPKVFVLWGNNAKKYSKLITNQKHLILEAPHPSPLSAYYGFFGSKPFSKINSFLQVNHLSPIDWSK